jgi:integrase
MAVVNKLTDTAVKKAKPLDKTYKLSDGGGLYLEVTATGAKYWRLKYRFAGKEKKLALGVYPVVSIAQAREKMRDAKLQLAEDKDPGLVKKQIKLAKQFSQANTFSGVGGEFIDKRTQEGAAKVTIDKIEWILRDKLNPVIGNLPISEITPVQLLSALRLIEKAGAHETANRAKRVAGQVLRFAVSTGRAERDISQDLTGALIIAKPKHRAAIINSSELATFLKGADSYQGSPEVKAALVLTPMLFQRPGEMRHMEWGEIDWDQEVWEIPAEKMKMRQPHVVPLPKQALDILRELRLVTGTGQYVFPSGRRGGKPLSENGVLSAIRTMGYSSEQVTPHGFRATARTLLDETLGFRVDFIEQQLAHAVKDANGRAYNRTKYLPERKQMMQSWADYLDQLKNGN